MKTTLWATVCFLFTAAPALAAEERPSAAPVGSTPPPTSAPADSTPASTDSGIGHPWNPDVHDSNIWPYDKAQVIDTDYCGPPGEFWLRAEFYIWQLKAGNLPPLVTAGPTGSGGVLGVPGVAPVFGTGSPSPSPYFGGRFTGGVWFESEYKCGFEGSYFFLADRAVRFAGVSQGQAGSPDLALPFVNGTTGLPASVPIASAGFLSGLVNAQETTEFQGAEGDFVFNLCRTHTWDFNVVAGFRYLDLGGDLQTISGTGPAGGFAPPLAPTTAEYRADDFSARNHFYGGEVGGRFDFRWHSLVLTMSEKVSLGERVTDININGGTIVQEGGAVTSVTPGGVLAQLSNIGRHADQAFTFVDEVGLQAGWQICDYVQVFAGYQFIYWGSVVRVGDIVDTTVNLAPATGPVRPMFTPHSTDFWAHGVNVGLEVRY